MDGLYKAFGNFNGSPKWKHTESGLFLFWDPKKEGSKGGDRSHWKVGTLINNAEIGYLDTYDTRPFGIFGMPYDPRYWWSIFTTWWPACTRCNTAHWEAIPPEFDWIKVECA